MYIYIIIHVVRCASEAPVATKGMSREPKAVAGSSAYSEGQKLNSNSPLLGQSVPDTLPPLILVRVLVRTHSSTFAGMALSSDSKSACMTKRKSVGLSGHRCLTPAEHGSATGSPFRSKITSSSALIR